MLGLAINMLKLLAKQYCKEYSFCVIISGLGSWEQMNNLCLQDTISTPTVYRTSVVPYQTPLHTKHIGDTLSTTTAHSILVVPFQTPLHKEHQWNYINPHCAQNIGGTISVIFL